MEKGPVLKKGRLANNNQGDIPSGHNMITVHVNDDSVCAFCSFKM